MKGLASAGRDRVREHSSVAVNERIDEATDGRLRRYATASPDRIGHRLAELDYEWDVDRALLAVFPVVGGMTYALGIRQMRRRRRWSGWLSLFSVQLSFLMMHALIGWCPPTAVLRRLGYRTHREIDAERAALECMLDERGLPTSTAAATEDQPAT